MGYMDYGFFDIEKSTDIRLRYSNLSLNAGSLRAPPLLLCNAVLSQIPQDVVMMEDGVLKRGLLSLIQPVTAGLIGTSERKEEMVIPGKAVGTFE